MLRLSVLDQSPVRSGGTPADAIRETLGAGPGRRPARLSPLLAGRAPLHAGAGRPGARGPHPARWPRVTTGIRVGSGGVMLQHYSALKVAESFRVLETLHPGPHRPRHRPGARQRPAHRPRAGRAGRAAASTTSRARSPTSLGFLHGDLPPEHPFGGVLRDADAAPRRRRSGCSAPATSRRRWPRTSAPASRSPTSSTPTAAPRSRAPTPARFKPSAAMAEPRASVAVFVVCAPTEEEAVRLAQSRDLFIVAPLHGPQRPLSHGGRGGGLRSTTAREWMIVEHARRRRIAGTPAQCRERLEALAAEYGVDEVVVVTITETWETRRAVLRAAGGGVRADAARLAL